MSVTINAEQRRILVRYAAGEELPDIAKATRINGDVVNALVQGPLVKFDRRRAGELVRAYDRVNGQAELARQMGSVQRPVEPPKVSVMSARPTVRDLLDEAEATGDRWLVIRVGKVRALLEEIRTRMETVRAEQELRSEVARLEGELAAAKARLKGDRTPVVEPANNVREIGLNVGPSSGELRAWAAERGIECSPIGRVSKAVREAWDAEQTEVAS